VIGPVARRAPAPAAAAALLLVSGIFLGSWSTTGAGAACALLGASGLALAAGAWRPLPTARRTAFAALWLAGGFLCGFERIAMPARTARETFARVPPGRDRADLVEGVLADFWSGAPPRAHGRLRAERIWQDGRWRPFPADVFLFVSGEESIEDRADRGDRVRLVGHLELEGSPASERDIEAPWPAYRISVKSALRVERRGSTLLSVLTAPNHWLHGRLPPVGRRGAAFDRDVRGPLAALLLGRTADLERGLVARYRRGGLYHLLVLSGLHVGLAAALLLGILRAAGVTGKRRDALLLLGIACFVLVGGANPPALRAGLVCALALGARLLELPIGSLQAIGMSAIVLLLAVPRDAWSVGMVLTFSAVVALALLLDPIRSLLPARPSVLWSAVAAALAAQAGTAPVVLWRFNLVSAAAWLTAPLCVPIAAALLLVGSLVLASFAVGVFPTPLVFLFGAGARALEFLAERASGIAVLRPTPPLALVLLTGLALLLAGLSRRRWRLAWGAVSAALFLFLAVRPGPAGPERGFSLEALDVGQGDALLLRWQRHAVLVDGGGPFDLDARDFGRTRLLPKLLDRGVAQLDAAILTHPHPDHALGLFAVLEELPVTAFFRSTGDDEAGYFRDLEDLARRRGISATALRRGWAVRFSGAVLSVLHSGGDRRKTDATNNQSLVLLFERQGRRALLTGDAGAPTERALLATGAALTADTLKVGHHGSRGGSTPEFVAAVAPRTALLSCGRENRFGHPAPETLATLSAARVHLLRTDLLSDVRVELSPGTTRLSWRGRP